MLKEFKAFIGSENLIKNEERTLLAISGGIDSVVMCELFQQAGFTFGIAHCNFNLRGNESDTDELFVKDLANKYQVPFYCKQFLTKKLAKEKKISIQMAARELRYQWFEDIRLKENYHSIATGHQLDDQLETFFINLLRSTGIAGFHGILPRQGNLIRPLLFSYREDIVAFARENNLSFREDSSNLETKYLRNKIRHEIIPVFRELNQTFSQMLTGTIKRMRETEVIFRNVLDETRKKIIRQDMNGVRIHISELKKLTPIDIFAYELLSPFGFNETAISDILKLPVESSGSAFYSSTHRLIKDRKELIINPLSDKLESRVNVPEIIIHENRKELRKPIHLAFIKQTKDQNFSIDPSHEMAYFDVKKIVFPLILRRWEKGDSFYPLGMNRKKKLSDFFIDQKFSIPEKEDVWLLCSGSQILWIIGYRIDHRYRVTPRTKEVMQVKWIEEK